MKVLFINGSPHKTGSTSAALQRAEISLNENDIETEMLWIGKNPVHGCLACRECAKDSRCIFDGDVVNSFIDHAKTADGLIVGSPVYYAGANGALIAALDRMFYAASSAFRYKPAAAISVARRAGTIQAVDQINKYFQINLMPIISSNYWPVAFGANAEDVQEDAEGLQIMDVLGKNMAWMLKSLEAAKSAGILPPEPEQKVATNFIRRSI
jgi:multimeric flavodoxin WrbA